MKWSVGLVTIAVLSVLATSASALAFTKAGKTNCAASYTNCEACVAPQTGNNGGKEKPCHWNLEANSCQDDAGQPSAKFCSGEKAASECNKCKKNWENYQKENAAKIAAQASVAAKRVEAKASGKDVGMASIAGLRTGMCRPTGTILKGVCVTQKSDCKGGRTTQRTDQCEHCCMLRPTQAKLEKSGDACAKHFGKCQTCLKADGCIFTSMSTCISRTNKAAHSGTEAGYEGIVKDCANHEKFQKIRRENKMKEIEKNKAAKAAGPAGAAAKPFRSRL